MRIRFLQDIANRHRNQVADVDDETGEALIASGVAAPTDGDAISEEINADAEPETDADATPKGRRR